MLEAYTESETTPGVFYRQTLDEINGRLFVACTCPAGRTRPGVALPCKHARRQLIDEPGLTRAPNQPPPAPGYDRNGRPIVPANVSGLVD